MRFRVSLAIGLLVSTPAPAEILYADILDAMPGRPDVTYLDVFRSLAPDLAVTAGGAAAGYLAASLRHASDDDGEPSAEAGTPIVVGGVAVLPVRAEGTERLLLLADLGDPSDRAESFTILALVDGEGATVTLLDVADVSKDMFTEYFDPPLLDLSPDDQAILVRNSHSNSNQAYESVEMLFVKDDRLVEIGSVSVFSDWWCGFERRQTVSFEPVPGQGRRYASIRAKVLYEGRAVESDCGENPDPFTQTIGAVFNWDETTGGFAPDSDAFDVLAEENERRF